MKISLHLGIFLAFVALQAAGNLYSFKEGITQSKKSGKPLLVYFYSENCPYCRQMDTYVLSDKEVETFINRNFVYSTVDIDNDEGDLISEKYRLHVTPSFLLLDKNGKEIHSFSGSRDKESFIKELNIYRIK